MMRMLWQMELKALLKTSWTSTAQHDSHLITKAYEISQVCFPFQKAWQILQITLLSFVCLEMFFLREFSPCNKGEADCPMSPRIILLALCKAGVATAFFQYLGTFFSCHRLSNLIETVLAMTCVSLLSTCGYNPSGPSGLHFSSFFKCSLTNVPCFGISEGWYYQ